MVCLKILTVVFTSTGVLTEVLFIVTNVPLELNTDNHCLVSTRATFQANLSVVSKSTLIAAVNKEVMIKKPGDVFCKFFFCYFEGCPALNLAKFKRWPYTKRE